MTICIMLLIGTTVQRPGIPGEGVVAAARKVPRHIGCSCSTCNAPRLFDVKWADGTSSKSYSRGDLVAVREAAPVVVVPERLGLAA